MIDKADDNGNAGVFGTLTGNNAIENVKLENTSITVTDADRAGALIGSSEGGGSLTVKHVESHSDSSITAKEYAGGLIGYAEGDVSVIASASYSDNHADGSGDGQPGSVKATSKDGVAGGLIGGLVDTSGSSKVEGCAAANVVTAEGSEGVAGGLIGQAGGTVDVKLSYAGGVTTDSDPASVTGAYAGGLIGQAKNPDGTNPNVTVEKSYSTATPKGSVETGGLSTGNNVTVNDPTVSYGADGLQPRKPSDSSSNGIPYDGDLLNPNNPGNNPEYPYRNLGNIIAEGGAANLPDWLTDGSPIPEWITNHVGDWPPVKGDSLPAVIWGADGVEKVSDNGNDVYTVKNDSVRYAWIDLSACDLVNQPYITLSVSNLQSGSTAEISSTTTLYKFKIENDGTGNVVIPQQAGSPNATYETTGPDGPGGGAGKWLRVTLDDITEQGQRFSDLFPNLNPAQEIRIHAKSAEDNALSVSDLLNDPTGPVRWDGTNEKAPKPNIASPLYDIALSGGAEAGVTNIRHLQNLDTSVSNVGTGITSAKLAKDLDWEGRFDDSSNWNTKSIDVGAKGAGYSAASFYGIENPSLTDFNGQGHTLRNFVIDRTNDNIPNGSKDAGLFRELTGDVENLNLESFTVKAKEGGNAGVLAANAEPNASGARIEVENIFINTNHTSVEATNYAGGMIGYAEGDVSVIASASYSEDGAKSGENGHPGSVAATSPDGVAGGLIGGLADTSGKSKVEGCAAANIVTASNDNGVAGGLIGQAQNPNGTDANVTIEKSYSAATPKGSEEKGGLYTGDNVTVKDPKVSYGADDLKPRKDSDRVSQGIPYDEGLLDADSPDDNPEYPYRTLGNIIGEGGSANLPDWLTDGSPIPEWVTNHVGDWPPSKGTSLPAVIWGADGVDTVSVDGDKLYTVANDDVRYAWIDLSDCDLESQPYITLSVSNLENNSDTEIKDTTTLYTFEIENNSVVRKDGNPNATYETIGPDGTEGGTGKWLRVTLDDITTEGQRFSDLFPNLNPAKEIRIHAKASEENDSLTVNDLLNDPKSPVRWDGTDKDAEKPNIASPLYDIAFSKGDKAGVTNIRHLQNLDTSVSGVGDEITDAKLFKDLDWKDGYWNTQSIYVGDNGGSTNKSFYGIENPNLTDFDGQGHTLSNFVIDRTNDSIPGGSKDAGLFRTLTGDVENLNLESFTVKAGGNGNAGVLAANAMTDENGESVDVANIFINTNNASVTAANYAGGMIGYAEGPISVTSCASYSKDFADGSENGHPGSVTATGAHGVAGGLIGAIQDGENVTVTGCAAANVVKAGDGVSSNSVAGGLIGQAAGKVDVSYSYAGGVNAESGGNVQGAYAGGLIGRAGNAGGTGANNVTLENVYSSATAKGTEKTDSLFTGSAAFDDASYGADDADDTRRSDNPVTAKPYDKELLTSGNAGYPYESLQDMIKSGENPPDWLKNSNKEWIINHVGDWPVKKSVTFRYLFAYDDDSPIRAAEQDTNSRAPASSLGANFFAAVRNYVPVSLPFLESDVKPVSWDWTNAANDLREVSGTRYVLVTEDATAPATGQVTTTDDTTVTFPKLDTNTFNRQNFYMGYWAWNFQWSDGETYEARYYPKYANGDLDNSGNVVVYKATSSGEEVVAIRPTDGQPWPQSVPSEDANGGITMELLETELVRPDKTDANAGTVIFKAHGQQDKPAFQLQAWAVRATLDEEGRVVPGTMTYLGMIDTKIGQIEEENGRKVIKMVLAEHDTVLSGCEFNPDNARWYNNSDLAPEHLLNSVSSSSGGTTYSRITNVPLDPDVTNIYAMYTSVETRTVRVNFKINGSTFKTYSYVYKSGDAVDLEFHVPVVDGFTPRTWGLSGATESNDVVNERIHIQVDKLEESRDYEVIYTSRRTSKLRVIHLLDYSENVGVSAIQVASGDGKRTLTSDFVNDPSYRVILENVVTEPAAGQLNKEKYALSIGSNGDSGAHLFDGDGGAYLSDVYEIESNDVYNPEGDTAVFVKSGDKWYLNPDKYADEYKQGDDKRIEVSLPSGYSIDDDKDDDIIYTQVIVYHRKAYRLNIDLSGGKLVKTLSNGKTSSQKALPAVTVYAGQETPTAAYLDSSNSERLQRSQYTSHGYYFMSRAEYLALKDVSSVRTYNAANSAKYKASETMPPEDRVAVAIWTLNNPAFGTVRLDVYLQKKTDNKDATDAQKQYDFLATYEIPDVPVGQTYSNSSATASNALRKQINDKIALLKATLKSEQNITLTETFGSASFFQRNAANSDLNKAVVPGEYNSEGDNVIKIKYDRAKIRIIFGGSNDDTGKTYYLVKNVTTAAHAVNLYNVEYVTGTVSKTETCWYYTSRNTNYYYSATSPGTSIYTNGGTGAVTIDSQSWTRTGRYCYVSRTYFYEATRTVQTPGIVPNATLYQGTANQDTVGWYKVTSDTTDTNNRYVYNADGDYTKFGAKTEENGVTYVVPLYVQSEGDYLEPSQSQYEWGADGQFQAKDVVEWRFEENAASRGDQYVEGLYQSPLKTSGGELFIWPQNIRFRSANASNGTSLTFLTYFSPASPDDPKWNSSQNRFNYYMYRGYDNTADVRLNFHTEKLGVRRSTDMPPAWDDSPFPTGNYTPPGTPPSTYTQLSRGSNGKVNFGLSDKFDGYSAFAYDEKNNGSIADGKPGGSFMSGIDFANGGKIYNRRNIYTVGYDNAIGMLTEQPSATDRSAAQNYYNYPIKRLYEEELEQLPKLTNDNYPEGDADYTFAGWSTALDFYDKESYVTDGDGQFVTYQNGQLVPDTQTHTMPSNGLNYIAMWSAPRNVQLMAPVEGTANSKHMQWEQLTTTTEEPITVQKYTALTGDHNGYEFAKDGSITKKVYDGRGREVADEVQSVMGSLLYRFRVPKDLPEGQELEIRWYLDEKCVMEFDPARDLVIEDNMKLYANLVPDQREQEYTVYYIADMPDGNGNTVYLHDEDTFWGLVNNSSIDRPQYDSLSWNGDLYTLSAGEITGQTLTQTMVDNGIYYVYSKTEIEPWNFTVYDWLDAGGGVYLRLGQTEYEQILDRRIVFFPDELRGFRLSASYKSLLVEPDEDDGLHTVTNKHKILNVIYELDETQLAFWGGAFAAGSIGNAPTQNGGKLAFYRPEALGLLFNAQGELDPQLLEEYLRLGEHLKATHTGNGDSTALRNEWQDGGWKWLWARSNDEGQSFGELSGNAYELCVDYVYTGNGTSVTRAVRYPMSGDTDSALTVGRTESGSLPSAPGRYSVVAEIYARIPGDSATKATLYTFPAVTVDLTE